MTDLPVFYYATGTSYLFNHLGWTVGQQLDVTVNVFGTDISFGNVPVDNPIWVEGVDNDFYYWDGFIPNDPFPKLLSPDLWQYKYVPYPASTVFMGPSIEIGVDWVIDQIEQTPIGTPFALGGYSQGAAVMSRIYNECRNGRLRDRRADLRAIVAYGNPMRGPNHFFPGSSGYSGACDIPGSATGGGGTFPVLSTLNILFDSYIRRFAQLQETESLFWNFTMPNEVISGVGGSDDGLLMRQFATDGLRLIPIAALGTLAKVMNELWNQFGVAPLGVPAVDNQVAVTDPKTGALSVRSGGGHIMYPFFPPPNADGSIPTSGDTCYQLAAKYLNRVGAAIYDELYPTVPEPVTPAAYQWFSSLPGE